ncbi:MAG: IS3 family transposase [Fusobacteriaceae bacterium]
MWKSKLLRQCSYGIFNSNLKKELIYPGKIDDQKTTQLKVFDYIEGFYNKNRI